VIHSLRQETLRVQFARLKPLLPNDTRGKPKVDDRRVISGIIQGAEVRWRWIDAPEVYGPRKTLYNRCVRWAATGGKRDNISRPSADCAAGEPRR
jgi:transposase